ncbi:hypothetical protein [Selenomonas ruminantium]|uniref:Uncharacterized protein n=1 Tax=Selenomonas ruminantium TaxID=971 RepID=A0A1K1N9H4_SELRU|nr:hypothetical protein [Selenomonas ruminantium]SFW31975.1 hypothetical protein SAMN02910323_1284 [Selenomonas ruminantium]
MIKKEQNKEKTSWMELLLSLDSMCITFRDENLLASKFPIQDSWKKLVHGKFIIFFYAGVNFQREYCGSIEERVQQYMNLLCALGDSLGNMQDAVLWWFDDGSLRALLDAVEDEKERNKLECTYMWTIQLHLAKAVHDESGDFARALAWGSVYYGEKSDYGREFQKVGKVAATYTLTSNDQSLESWLGETMREHSITDLDPEWEKCIQGRKVMLFPLQPQTLLIEGERVVSLLENLVYLAQEHKDICIWWLVDKDLDKVVSLLIENLRLNFNEARSNFKKVQNVIYDESGETGRALEYTDVCFGEPRNANGCHAVRPAIEPPYHSLKELPECPQVGAYCRDRQKIYFIYNVRNVFGVLCEADLSNDKVKILCQVPNDEEMTNWGLEYVITVQSGKKLIMPPYFSSNGFLEYDMLTGKLQSLPCEEKVWEPNLERCSAFGMVTEWHDSIYFLGNANGLIVEYRKKAGKYVYHKNWLGGIESQKKPIFGGGELVDGVWYLVATNMNMMLALDMESMNASMVNIPLPDGFQLRSISRNGDELWLTPIQGNCLGCIHMDSKEIEFFECQSISKHQRIPFSSVVPWKQSRMIFPYFADEVQILQHDKRQVKPMPELTRKLVRPFEENDLRNEVFWARRGKDDESFLSFRERGTELVEFWPETGEVRYHKLKLESCDEQRLENLVHSWNLRNLLKPLTDEIEKASYRQYATTGQRIWKTVNDMY